MKKIISIFIVISILLLSLSSCNPSNVTAPTCDELIAAYKKAGYNIFHVENEYKKDRLDEVCSVKVWLDDEYEYVYFYFFESAEAAKAMDAEREYNIIIYLFSIIFGDPSWLFTETYGNIEYEYEDPKMIKPFRELIK